MPEYMIAGVPVNFPFEPYDVQKAYMEKVITCLRDGTNGVLESPTGTGKTLSLLCSSLAWLMTRKAEVKVHIQKNNHEGKLLDEMAMGKVNNWGVPKIIYASRTHSQLTQAMQELKRTSYNFMRAVVLGSRDQLCIHPEVMREQGNANKVQMCKLRVDSRTCNFHSRVDSKKEDPLFKDPPIMDIEDLVAVGRKLKMCPYFGSKELVADADITFMPYNYLLDPKARKANKVELANTIVILDEAHNIEKICEESASVQIRSSDIAVAIDDITGIMKAFSSDSAQQDAGDDRKDFTIDDLALLKEMVLDLEKAVDDIVVDNKAEGTTYPPSFMFELLAKANLTPANVNSVTSLLDRMIQYLAVQSENGMFRKGRSLEMLLDLLTIVLKNKEESMAKVYRSFKVHVQLEEEKKQNNREAPTKDGWFTKANTSTTPSVLQKSAKIVNYWCFNPGFGMEQLLNKNVRSVILTSGTLAPLKPLIAELAIPVAQHLENPHIVSTSQVYVKIIGAGPDREPLISNYANRDNPKYVSSLGQTILNVSRIVPDGLLVFFPSYPLLNQCVNSWQASGLWADISRHKPIYVEPRDKETFTTTMEEFYQSIRDSRGACFMAVCRGKVSEGLDFADRNGRAVIITGLPFPPLKDPKVMLKKRYLEDNRTKENELLTGQAWYSLEATRAVNQAIGRVIRHRSDYGAILLCDSRFQYPSQVQQLSKWIRGHLTKNSQSTSFGPVVRELREFFKSADKNLPKPKERAIETLVSESCEEMGIVRSKHFSNPKEVLQKAKSSQFSQLSQVESTNKIVSWSPQDYALAMGAKSTTQMPSAMDFISRLQNDVSTIDFNNCSSASTSSSSSGLVSIHKRERGSPTDSGGAVEKKKRYKLVDNTSIAATPATSQSLFSQSSLGDYSFKGKGQLVGSAKPEKVAPAERVDFLRELRAVLNQDNFKAFTVALVTYKNKDTIDELIKLLIELLGKPQLHYMLKGMRRFLKPEHKEKFDKEIAQVL